MTQGALFAMATTASRELKDTNIRFNEMYLDHRIEYDESAAKSGATPSSDYGRNYEAILKDPELKGCRITVSKKEYIDNLKVSQKVASTNTGGKI